MTKFDIEDYKGLGPTYFPRYVSPWLGTDQPAKLRMWRKGTMKLRKVGYGTTVTWRTS